MTFTNPTQRKEFLRCRRRFFYRYLFEPISEQEKTEHARRRNLIAVREFGGFLVHGAVASMLRSMGEGEYRVDHAAQAKFCINEMFLVAAKSIATPPGEMISGMQLAETYNGASVDDIQEQLRYWRDTIPAMLEHAFRVALTLDIRQQSSFYKIETEREIFFRRNGQMYHYVIDLLIHTPNQTICVDWKTHSIDNEDLRQVRSYLDFLRIEDEIPVSRLTGLAVDLRNESIVPVHYDPFGVSRNRARSSSAREMMQRPVQTSGEPDFAPTPHLDLCLRCPYSSICEHSAVHRGDVVQIIVTLLEDLTYEK